jgi:hypothetical protein
MGLGWTITRKWNSKYSHTSPCGAWKRKWSYSFGTRGYQMWEHIFSGMQWQVPLSVLIVLTNKMKHFLFEKSHELTKHVVCMIASHLISEGMDLSHFGFYLWHVWTTHMCSGNGHLFGIGCDPVSDRRDIRKIGSLQVNVIWNHLFLWICCFGSIDFNYLALSAHEWKSPNTSKEILGLLASPTKKQGEGEGESICCACTASRAHREKRWGEGWKWWGGSGRGSGSRKTF